MSAFSRAKASGSIGGLFSHQTLSSTEGVRTTNLSLGERPVFSPVVTRKVPPRPRCPSLRFSAASISWGSSRL